MVADLGALCALVSLDISSNAISDLPLSMANLARLNVLNVDSNPLKRPPAHVSGLPRHRHRFASKRFTSLANLCMCVCGGGVARVCVCVCVCECRVCLSRVCVVSCFVKTIAAPSSPLLCLAVISNTHPVTHLNTCLWIPFLASDLCAWARAHSYVSAAGE